MNTKQLDKEMSRDLQFCIDDCLDCYRISSEALTYCLERGGRHRMPEHLKLLTDCLESCQLAANFMLRASNLHKHACAVCSAVCDRCAESCEAFPDDEMMLSCAEACHRAAESCKELASSRHNQELRASAH